MEWYKHLTSSADDHDISSAWDEFGDIGYVAFFVVLEIYGKEYNHRDKDGYLELSKKFLCRKLRRKWTLVERLMTFYSVSNRFQIILDLKNIRIKIPKFIKLASNWSSREYKLPTEVPTKKMKSTSSSTSLLSSSDNLIIINKEEDITIRSGLLILLGIEEYPFEIKADTKLLKELKVEYPDLNFIETIKGWKWWLPENKVKNYRASLRNRFLKGKGFKEDYKKKQEIIDRGKKEDHDQKLKEIEANKRSAVPDDIGEKKAGEILKMLEKNNKGVKNGSS